MNQHILRIVNHHDGARNRSACDMNDAARARERAQNADYNNNNKTTMMMMMAVIVPARP